MIICDYIKKLNSTLSKVYHGSELVMTTNRDYLKRIPLTFNNYCQMYLGEGFEDIQYCINYKGDGTDTWINIRTTTGTTTFDKYTETREGSEDVYDQLIIQKKEGSEDITISVRATWANNRTSTSNAHNKQDFRFIVPNLVGNEGTLHVFGNINSMLTHSSNFKDIVSLSDYGTYTFRSLFSLLIEPDKFRLDKYCSAINDLDVLCVILPNTVLSDGCYWGMYYCSNRLNTIPSYLLPANTVLAPSCCRYMFSYHGTYDKEGLTIERNALPSTVLANYCYANMFESSSGQSGYKLIKFAQGFKLPGTTLSQGCYLRMFKNCTLDSNSDIPENLLPATTMATSCYYGMFEGFKFIDLNSSKHNEIVTVNKSTKLKLPATTLDQSCYQEMFKGSSLSNTVKMANSYIADSDSFCGMYSNCIGIDSMKFNLRMPSTSVARTCSSMFSGCTGLKTADVSLLSGNLSTRTMTSMFSGCINLKSLTLSGILNIDYPYCMSDLCNGCTNLNKLTTDIYTWPTVNSTATENWLSNVAESGTLNTRRNITIPSGTSGLPNGWSHTYDN